MKAGWEVRPLGEVCEIYQPKTISKKEMIDDGAFPVFGANGVIGRYDQFNHEEPQLLVTCRGATCGAVNVSQPFSWITGNSMVVRPSSVELSQNFLKYFFLGAVDLKGVITGAAQPQITRASLSPVLLQIPPLEEQKQIVAVLDAAFEGLTRAKENAEANLQNARELFDTRVVSEFFSLGEKFGSKRIGDIADHRLGKMLDKNKNRGQPREYLRNLNVQWFEVDTSDLLEMRIEDDEFEKYSVDQGDLLICEGGYPGRAAIWPHSDRIFYQKALHRVRFTEPIYNRLLLYWLYFLDRTNRLSTHFSGAGIQHFTGKALAKFEMPFPPEDVAKRAVTAIEATKEQSEKVEMQYRTKLIDIADLRQSLLQKAFAGELT